ncbi:MAG: phosphate/phosphite/phosphonate ABC transporter substrate-binding protein [Pseudobdellovibrionaceae bacterium]|nr:phosphate/phosphite/phosphonate ABC transporter substrate-binding protein [Bdellovibrionales bacterium]USN46598.1 MAG: phosphate/phosphite/phosphonate ABC transporter substrate-binding protein [Pseudobdellovibrionaceae bacterium]
MKITRRIALSLLALVALSTAGCKQPEVGSKNRPFTMYFIPSIDAQTLATTTEGLVKHVQKSVSQKLYGSDEGFYVKSSIPTSYIAVVEAFGTGRADFAAFNTFSYILAKDIKKYPLEAILTVVHGNGETTYKGQIIARADSGINTLEDLKGKKFAFTDPASTSGYILPSQLLKKQGIELGDTVFAQKHDNVVTMVYQKQVDAGATYYSAPKMFEENGKKELKIQDARNRVLTQFPDVEDVVKIVGFTQEIPNEPWVIRQKMYEDPARDKQVREAVQSALLDFIKTPEGKKIMTETYNVYGLVPVSDANYDEIRKIITSSELNLEDVITKK